MKASNVFQALSKGEVIEHTKHLLVAPKCLQNKVLDMLDEEIAHARNGEEAYAGFKPGTFQNLYLRKQRKKEILHCICRFFLKSGQVYIRAGMHKVI